MKILQQVSVVLVAFVLAIGISLGGILSGYNLNFSGQNVQQITTESLIATSSQDPVKEQVVVHKLVCRYISGSKRCWHD